MEGRSSFTVLGLLLLLLLFIVISPSPLVSIHTVEATTDSDFFEDFEEEDFEEEDFEEEDFEEEDFEEKNSIQICCTWGSNLEDGSLTYHIDDDDMSEEQQQAVRNAIHEWDTKIEPLELEESSKKISDITIELGDDNDGEELAGQTITISNGYGFLVNAQITIYKGVQEYDFDTATIGQVAKHEMGHALGLGHANFDGNLMAEMVNYGTGTVSECEINAVIEANYWKLGGDGNAGPSITPSNSITC